MSVASVASPVNSPAQALTPAQKSANEKLTQLANIVVEQVFKTFNQCYDKTPGAISSFSFTARITSTEEEVLVPVSKELFLGKLNKNLNNEIACLPAKNREIYNVLKVRVSTLYSKLMQIKEPDGKEMFFIASFRAACHFEKVSKAEESNFIQTVCLQLAKKL
jgi:3-oxoacyl-ACP reductase-like protein